MTEVILRRIEDVHPYEKNPRLNDASVDAVAESIKAFGFRQPIIVDGDGVIITGHTRLKAAKKLGMKTVPVIVADDLSEEQVKAYRLADNKVGETSLWDYDLLDGELMEIPSFDMELFGFMGESPVFDDPDSMLPTSPSRDSEEIDLSDFDGDRFTCVCPRCKFRFNPKVDQ